MRTRYPMLRQSLWILPLTLAALAVTLSAQAPSNEAGRRLHALFDREWEWELAESPLTASSLGDKRWNDRWDDLSVAALDGGRSTAKPWSPRSRRSPARR